MSWRADMVILDYGAFGQDGITYFLELHGHGSTFEVTSMEEAMEWRYIGHKERQLHFAEY